MDFGTCQQGDGAVYSCEIKLGGQLYAELSRSGLNTLPVEDHAAYAMLGCTIDGTRLDGVDEPKTPFPTDPDVCARTVVAEGSVALLRNDCMDPTTLERSGEDANPECFSFLDDLDLTALRKDLPGDQRAAHPPFSARQFAQCFYGSVDGQYVEITRLYTRGEAGWTVEDYTGWGSAEKKLVAESVDKLTGRPAPLPLDGVIVVPGGLGVLYPAQLGYRAAEQILARLERLKNSANTKTMIEGPIVDPDAAVKQFTRSDTDVVIVPEGTHRDMVVSVADVQKLLDELKTQIDLYMPRVHIAFANDKTHITDQRTTWQMGPMKNYVVGVRQKIARVMRAAGSKVITFPDIQLESIADIKARYDFIAEAAAAKWIKPELASEQIALLVA